MIRCGERLASGPTALCKIRQVLATWPAVATRPCRSARCERQPPGRDPAGAAPQRPGVPPFARVAFTGVVAPASRLSRLAAIRQVPPFPPPLTPVRQCRVHGTESGPGPSQRACCQPPGRDPAGVALTPSMRRFPGPDPAGAAPFPPPRVTFARVAFTGGRASPLDISRWPRSGRCHHSRRPRPAVRPCRVHGRCGRLWRQHCDVVTGATGPPVVYLRSCTRLCKASHSAILPRFAASNHEGAIQWRQSTGLAAIGSSSAATQRLLPMKSVRVCAHARASVQSEEYREVRSDEMRKTKKSTLDDLISPRLSWSKFCRSIRSRLAIAHGVLRTTGRKSRRASGPNSCEPRYVSGTRQIGHWVPSSHISTIR